MSDKWKRFTPKTSHERKGHDSVSGSKLYLAVWDVQPEVPYHVGYLRSLGGSGYYAEVIDVIEMPSQYKDKEIL